MTVKSFNKEVIQLLTELNLPSDDCVGDVEVYQNGCKGCSGNSYRDTASSQFEKCKKCPAGEQPNTNNDGCIVCAAGVSKINN